MGQFCFTKDCISKKYTFSVTDKVGASNYATEELDFCNAAQGLRQPTFVYAQQKKGIVTCSKERETDAAGYVSSSDFLTSTLHQRSNKEVRLFTGFCGEVPTALALRSCEDAGILNHFVVGTEDGNIAVVNFESGESTRQWHRAHKHDVNCLTKPLSSGIFASASRDKLVKLWSVLSDQVLCEFYGHRLNVTSVTIDLDGTFLVSGSRDNTVRLWDVERAEELHSCDVKQNVVHFVQWVPQLNCVAQGGEDLALRLWDVRMSSTSKRALDMSLGFTLTSMDYHPVCCELLSGSSGNTLLTGHNGFNGRGAYVLEWDLRMQRRLRTLCGHSGTVVSVKSHPVQALSTHWQVVSASNDGSVAFFLLENTSDECDVIVKPENKFYVSEEPVMCLESCSNGDILALTCSGAVLMLSSNSHRQQFLHVSEKFEGF